MSIASKKLYIVPVCSAWQPQQQQSSSSKGLWLPSSHSTAQRTFGDISLRGGACSSFPMPQRTRVSVAQHGKIDGSHVAQKPAFSIWLALSRFSQVSFFGINPSHPRQRGPCLLACRKSYQLANHAASQMMYIPARATPTHHSPPGWCVCLSLAGQVRERQERWAIRAKDMIQVCSAPLPPCAERSQTWV